METTSANGHNQLPDEDIRTVSQRLRVACAGLKYKEVADRTGANHETVRRYLTDGSPTIEFLAQVADWRRISTEWLVHGRGPICQDEIIQLALDQAGPDRLCHALGKFLEEMRKTKRE